MDAKIHLIAFVVLFAIFVPLLWTRLRSHAARNPEWVEETKATSARERRRIARAVSEGNRLDNPRDARIAVGMAEQSLLVNKPLGGSHLVKLLLGVPLLVLGVLGGYWSVAALGLVFVLLAAWERSHRNRVQRRLERAARLNREQASLEAAGD